MNRRNAWIVTWLCVGVLLGMSVLQLRPDRDLTMLGSLVVLVTGTAALAAFWLAWGDKR
jgi:hypothetical protein